MRYTKVWRADPLPVEFSTLDDLAAALEAAALGLRKMARAGVRLAPGSSGPFAGGHAVLGTDDPEVAGRFGLAGPGDGDDGGFADGLDV